VRGIYKSEEGKRAIEAFYRKALDRWPVAHEQLVVPTRHGDTFVISCGPVAAPPVMLLHGSGGNSAVWIRDVAAWARHYRVSAIDMIGEPGFSAPSRPSLRSDAYAQWLDDVCDRLGVKSASFVAVSLGGALALDYAARRPARVTSLSLLSPAGIGARRKLFMIKGVVMLLLGKVGVSRALSSAVGKTPIPAPVAQYMKLIFENFRPRRELLPVRTDGELKALSMPMQVIVGRNDAMLHAAQTRDRLARLVPHAEVTFLEDAGHMLPPQTDRVSAFLARVWSGDYESVGALASDSGNSGSTSTR
jgi:pimeloyl-ACP methyl ester carboxylesterase